MKPLVQNALLVAVALTALAAGALFKQHQNTPQAAAADGPTRLQNLTLPDLEGTQQPLNQWRGKKWVVNFWATWCTPCREEMPMLGQLARAHEGQVQFIGIGIDTPEAMKKFIQETPVPYPLLTGGNEAIELSAALGNSAMALPFTVVLDEHGKLIGQHMGKVTEAQIEAMLSKPAGGALP